MRSTIPPEVQAATIDYLTRFEPLSFTLSPALTLNFLKSEIKAPNEEKRDEIPARIGAESPCLSSPHIMLTPVWEVYSPTFTPAQQQTLKDAALRVFHEQVNAKPAIEANATSLDTLAMAILDSVEHELASALRIYNEQKLPQPRLPVELWCRIWEGLPETEKLKMTQVCHDWRAAADDCPQLWTQLNFESTVHQDDCECEDYCGESAKNREVERCETCGGLPPTQLWTNLPLVQLNIDRSGSLPLDLTIDVEGGENMDRTGLRSLAFSLAPHLSRLRSVHLMSDNMDIIQTTFISNFRSLPNLQSLYIDCGEAPDHELEINVELPLLEDFRIDGESLRLSQTNFSIVAPELKTLFSVFSTGKDIARLLKGCPKAKDITFKANSSENLPEFEAEDLKLIENFFAETEPDRVCFSNICEPDGSTLAPVFQRPKLVDITIECGDSEPGPSVIEILKDIIDPGELLCQLTDDTTSITVLGLGGKKRIISLYDCYLDADSEAFPTRILTDLVPAALQSLSKFTIHTTLFTGIISHFPATQIRELVVECSNPDEGDSVIEWLADTEPVPVEAFANLETLTIRNDEDDHFTIDDTDVDILVEQIRTLLHITSPRNLKTIRIDNITFSSGPENWSKIAEQVVELP